MALPTNLARRTIPGGREEMFNVPVAAGQHIYQGSSVDICAGFAKVSVGSPTSLQASGVTAMTEADNSNGGNGAISVLVVTGRVEAFTNDTGTPLVAADRGKKVRAIDDDTVGLAGNGSIQGTFIDFVEGSSETLVWVKKEFTKKITSGEFAADALGAGLGLDASGKVQRVSTSSQVPTTQALASDDAMVIASTASLVKLASDGGAVTYATALPAGVAGQRVTFMGTSDTDVLTIPSGLNLKLVDGQSIALDNYATLEAVYNGSTWVEVGRATGQA